MREIKFRAWDTEKNLMFKNVSSIQRDGIEVMQFTGIKDKNDVEIYEGDIVNGSFTGSLPKRNQSITGTVCFDQGVFFLNNNTGIQALRLFDQGIEVIGNIYENPELLEK